MQLGFPVDGRLGRTWPWEGSEGAVGVPIGAWSVGRKD